MLANEKSLALTKKFNEYYPGNHSNLRHMSMEATNHKVFIDHAKGNHMWDIDGNEYVEFTSGLGPTILGNCDDEYANALCENIKNNATILSSGVFFSEDDIFVAEKLIEYVPCAEQLKFQVTGTEAVQAAIRIARGYTGKSKIVRFAAHYHGWMDNVLGGQIRPAGNGEYELYKDPDTDDELTQGLSPHAWDDIIILPWNDFDALKIAFERHYDEIAIIHLEPMVCNTFGMYPKPGFLELIRELCDKYNVVMSFDEVITGFRLGLGGAQKFFGVTPDICTMAKAISAGLPIALIAGKKKIMSYCFDDRKVIAPGTYNGWNLGMCAIATTIKIMERDDGARYKNMLKLQEKLTAGIVNLAEKYNLDVRVTEAPGVFNTIFGVKGGRTPLYILDELETMDMDFMIKLRYNLQQEGLITLPAFRWYMTLSHTDEDINFTLAKMDKCIGELVNV